jgi:hypothetical protein
MAQKPARRAYAKPSLRRRCRLAEVTEGDNIFVTGGHNTIKGGCFSNKR